MGRRSTLTDRGPGPAIRMRWALLATAGLLGAGAAGGGTAIAAPAAIAQAPADPGREIIVRFERDIRSTSARNGSLRAADARASRSLPASGLTVARVEAGTSAAEAAEAAEDLPGVAWAEPNGRVRAHLIPNDPLFGEQWGHHNTGQAIGNAAAGTPDADVDSPEAWNANTGGDSVLVAVIDTGVDRTNPDLVGKLWTNPGESGGGRETNGIDDDGNGLVDDVQGWDYVDGDNDAQDLGSGTGGAPIDHGTVAASIIAGRAGNGFGGAGVSHGARVVGIRALGRDGGGSFADIAEAMNLAARYGAKVVNLSLGGANPSQAISDAIADNPDVVFVASAGNNGSNNDVTPSYPCNDPAPNVVCVAATDRNDMLAGFSNFGAAAVDIAAPGVATLGSQNARQVVYSEDFESGFNGWLTSGTNNTWALTTSRSVSGSASLTDSPPDEQDYQNNTESFAFQTVAEMPDLSGRRGCRVHAHLDRDIVALDRFGILASSGGTTFTLLESYSGSTGDSFAEVSADLGAFENGPVRLAFLMDTTAVNTADGVYVDDVTITCLGGAYSATGAGAPPFGPQFIYANGTSFSAPFVAGAAAVLLGGGVTPGAAIAALFAGADRTPALNGLVGNGRLNVASALAATAAPPAAPAGPPVTVAGAPAAPKVGRLGAATNAGPPRARLLAPVVRGDRAYLPVALNEAATVNGWVKGPNVVSEARRIQTRITARAAARENATRIVSRSRVRHATKRILGLDLPAGRSLIPLGRLPRGGSVRVRLTPTDEFGRRGRSVTRRVTLSRRREAPTTRVRRSLETLPAIPATPGPESPVPGLTFPKPAPPAPPAPVVTVPGPPTAFDLCSLFTDCGSLPEALRRPLTAGGPSRAELASIAGQPVPAPTGIFVGLPKGSAAGAGTRQPRRIGATAAVARLSGLSRRFRGGDPYLTFRISRAATVVFETTRAAPPGRANRVRERTWTVKARRGLNVVEVPRRWRCVRKGLGARGASYLAFEAQHRANVRIRGNRLVGAPNPRCLG